MAEFTKIMEIRKRICNSFKRCNECPLNKNPEQKNCVDFMVGCPDKAEEIILKWDEEHPVKTRLTDFLEKYPNAPMGDKGLSRLCCLQLGYKCDNCVETTCQQCWNTPLED